MGKTYKDQRENKDKVGEWKRSRTPTLPRPRNPRDEKKLNG